MRRILVWQKRIVSMNRTWTITGLAVTALTAGLLSAGMLLPQSSNAAPGAANVRPIEDFIKRQGTFCLDESFQGGYTQPEEIVDQRFIDKGGKCPTGETPLLLVPPLANFIGQSDSKTNRSASMDYAGLLHWRKP